MPLLCRMVPSSSPMAQHEALRHGRSHTTQPTVNGQRLASSHEQIHLITNTRIVHPSSPCRGKAIRNSLLFKPLILPHSLLYRSFFVSCSDSLSRSRSRSPSLSPARKCSSVVLLWTRSLFIAILKCKNIGKGHGGNHILGEIILKPYLI